MSGNSPPAFTVWANGTGVFSDQWANGVVQGAGLLADARDFVGLNGMTIWLNGLASAGDGGQGCFYYNTSSTATDDGGVTTIQPQGVLTGRWLRLSGVGTGIQTVTNIPALRALTSGESPVFVQGYETPDDGGGGMYVIGAAGSDNGGSIIVSGNGTYYLETFGQAVSVLQFGADPTGAADSTTKIQAAITAFLDVRVPAGTYKITNTITMSANGQRLIGAGAGDNHDTGTAIVAPTQFIWDGSLGGTMVSVASAGSQFISGCQFGGIFLNGNTGTAAIGIEVVSHRLGTFEIVGAHFTTSLAYLTVNDSLSEPAGCSENLFTRISAYQTNAGDGSALYETGSASWDCSQNLFLTISGDFLNGDFMFLDNCDSEVFQIVKCYRANGGTGTGVVFNGGPAAIQSARNNMMFYVGVSNCDPPVFASGTSFNTVASNENNIVFLDTASNPNPPSIDTGAILWWGEITAPTGLRSLSAAEGSLYEVNTGGVVTQEGTTGTVAAGGSTAVSFVTAFASIVTNVQVTARSAATSFSASASSLEILIKNASGGAATDFYWRVEGE